MSYAAPRPAKLKIQLETKVIGTPTKNMQKIGKKVQVQRNPSQPGMFIVWISKKELAQVPAEKLTDTIEYTDGRPEGWQ